MEHRIIRRKGFTLIELLIVVAIIAILAAIAIPNFLEAQTRSKVSRVKSDQRSSSIALESFHIDHNWYPPDGFWLMDAWGQFPGAMAWVDNNCLPWFTPMTIDQLFAFIHSGSAKAPNFWRFDNCLFLTTPIAYMTSIPKDPFLEKDTWWVGSMVYLNMYDRWKYSLTKDPNAQPVTLDGKSNGYSPIDGKSTFRWSLSSLGPDNRADGSTLPPYLQYDPTNGTISKGNIFRVGP